MRDILQGFTMWIDGVDYGIDTEEVELPFLTPVTQDYRGGGMDLGVKMPMSALEPLEFKVKMAGQNPEVMKRMALGPGKTTRVTFRGAVTSEDTGVVDAHVCIVEGAINGDSRDRWNRGEKVGFEFVINGVKYMKYTAADEIIHEVQAYPPKRIVNGIDQLADVNQALGY